jgi:hypothetical protein
MPACGLWSMQKRKSVQIKLRRGRRDGSDFLARLCQAALALVTYAAIYMDTHHTVLATPSTPPMTALRLDDYVTADGARAMHKLSARGCRFKCAQQTMPPRN